MILSIFLVALITFGGLAITYVFADDEPLMWRLAVGNVIGTAILGTFAFLLALLFGFNTITIIAAFGLTVLPILLLTVRDRRKRFSLDWSRAKGKIQGASLRKFWRFTYYAFFFVLFLLFFERAMFETTQGIFTGGSQNLGDLPFHLGAILGFAEGNNFPPENPSFAGARFSYPFVTDLVTACFVKLGAGVKDAMLVQNVAWAFSLLVILERFVYRLLNDRFASKIAPFLLFFSGGLGFIWFFGDYLAQGKGFVDFLWNLPKDYTIGEEFRWGNSMVTLFLTQRSLLLGMPITLIILGALWNIFTAETLRRRDVRSEFSIFRFPFSTIIIGLIAGLLPLIHLHSLAVLFAVTAFLLFLRFEKWREWIGFGIGVCVFAIPQLVWSMSGSATQTSEFFSLHFGWDSGATNFFWFWLKNTGILIPMIAFGIYLVYSSQRTGDVLLVSNKKEKGKREKASVVPSLIPHPSSLLLFYLPFAFIFVLANVAKLAPWQWDNIKVLIYWFAGSIPFVAFAISWMWRRETLLKFAAAACFLILIFSGALDVWRTMSGQINYKVFDADAVLLAERLKTATPKTALFLNAPTYNTAIVLSGRRSLMRYPGHLSSHGIDYKPREDDVKQIYQGGEAAGDLLRKYGITHVLISPEEKNTLAPNEDFFRKFPVSAEVGSYKVYKVRN